MDIFISIVKDMVSKIYPLNSNNIKNNKSDWKTNKVYKAIKRKGELWHKFRSSNGNLYKINIKLQKIASNFVKRLNITMNIT